MSNTKDISLILNPVRIRILGTFTLGSMTVSDLALFLDDVPRATLYRHVNVLVKAGFLVPVRSTRKRGTLEYRYQLFESGDRDDPEGDTLRLASLLGFWMNSKGKDFMGSRLFKRGFNVPEKKIEAFWKEVYRLAEKYHSEENPETSVLLECFMTAGSVPRDEG